jgi:hypothetical protein
MLMALGPRLQRLSLFAGASYRQCDGLDDLVPVVLAHCPLLAHLAVGYLGPGNVTAVSSTIQKAYMAAGCHVMQKCSATNSQAFEGLQCHWQ